MVAAENPKIYHIVHVDRLASIAAGGFLWCDAECVKRGSGGTTIGMSRIKERRLGLYLDCHPGLRVGDCVPFYFCPRSIMLYLIFRANDANLAYRDGQGPIVHLVADLHRSVAWAKENKRRWAFTLSNAGSSYFEDRCDLRQLHEINWAAVNSTFWAGPGVDSSIKEGKQAEFLMEFCFPWTLIEQIGVCSVKARDEAEYALRLCTHKPEIRVRPEWYYGEGGAK